MSAQLDLIAEIAELKKARQEDRARIERLEEERDLFITKKCLSIEDVAKEAGCSVQKIRDAYNKALLPARYPNAKRKFHREEVITFLRGMCPLLPSGSKRKQRK